MKWITREHPKIDRLACPWLIRRFIDPLAEFIYVPFNEVAGAEFQKSAGAVYYCGGCPAGNVAALKYKCPVTVQRNGALFNKVQASA